MFWDAPADHVPSETELDLQARWLPTEQAVKMARAAVRAAVEANLAARPHDIVAIVPMYQPGKEHGWWTIGQRVETVAGVVLVAYSGAGETPKDLMDYHKARDLAERTARGYLGDEEGTTATAVVDLDGKAAVFEGYL
jgi:hypothetical protein